MLRAYMHHRRNTTGMVPQYPRTLLLSLSTMGSAMVTALQRQEASGMASTAPRDCLPLSFPPSFPYPTHR